METITYTEKWLKISDERDQITKELQQIEDVIQELLKRKSVIEKRLHQIRSWVRKHRGKHVTVGGKGHRNGNANSGRYRPGSTDVRCLEAVADAAAVPAA